MQIHREITVIWQLSRIERKKFLDMLKKILRTYTVVYVSSTNIPFIFILFLTTSDWASYHDWAWLLAILFVILRKRKNELKSMKNKAIDNILAD